MISASSASARFASRAFGSWSAAEALDQRSGQLRRVAQRADDGVHAISRPALTQVAEPGAQPDDRARIGLVGEHQFVERVIFGAAVEHRGDRAFEHFGIGKQRKFIDARGQAQREIMDHDRRFVVTLGARRAALAERGRNFLEHFEPEMFERGHDVGQRERADRAVDLEPQAVVAVEALAREPDAARIVGVEIAQAQDVARGFLGIIEVAVIGREGRRKARRERRRAPRIAALGERRLDLGLPAADHLFELRIERFGIGHHAAAAQVERVAQQGRAAVFEHHRPADHARFGFAHEQRFDRKAAARRHFVARQPDERRTGDGRARSAPSQPSAAAGR
jgi:hypothetical protein